MRSVKLAVILRRAVVRVAPIADWYVFSMIVCMCMCAQYVWRTATML